MTFIDDVIPLRDRRPTYVPDGSDMAWSGWSLARIVVAFVGVAFAALGVQVYLMHARSAFHRTEQYAPVIGAPLLAIAAAWVVAAPSGAACTVFVVLGVIGVLTGALGSALHVRGVVLRVGGLTFHNLVEGPPVLLPVLYAALATLGLFAARVGLGAPP